jgi:hypothetical protein
MVFRWKKSIAVFQGYMASKEKVGEGNGSGALV